MKTEARELIRAAKSAAPTIPFNPDGNNVFTSSGRALSFEARSSRTPSGIPGCVKQKAITPGITKRKRGVSFKKPAKIVPFLASEIFFAESTLCTIF